MKKINLFSFLFVVILTASQELRAQQSVIRIPLNTDIKPSADLMNEKKKALSYGEIFTEYKIKASEQRYGKYLDLSKLSPIENKYWQDQKWSAVDEKLHAEMPSQGETLFFDDYLGAVREAGIYSVYVRPAKNKNISYGLTFGRQIHASLMKSALLRKVGYYQESPKFLKTIKMKFESLEKMQNFIETSFCEKGPSEEAIDCLPFDPFKDGFLSEKNETEMSLVVHGAYLEKLNPEVPSLFDGLAPVTANNLQYLAQSRAFRALAIPFVMGNAGESINRFSPQAVSIRGGWAEMNFENSHYFDHLTSHDDIKWVLSRYAKLQQKDWDEIVEAGQYPECTIRLVKSLLLHRYRNMLESYFGSSVAKGMLNSIQIEKLKDINTACVTAGKVTVKKIEGYPQDFSHGPRQSPFETSDLIKYMKIATQSAAIQVALNQLGDKLQKVKITDQKINGVEFGPSGARLLTSTSGVLAGLNFNANRAITTGNFYGSQAPVQMVDTVSVSAGLGFQNIFEGLNGIRRNFGASASYVRSFTHVIPIDSIKQADKTPWIKNLMVNSRLKNLAAPLKDGNLTEFLKNLKLGEVFTITDAVSIGGSLGWTSGLDSIVGFVKGLSASLSFDTNKQVILRQVQYVRTADGLQVFIRDVDSHKTDQNGEAQKDHQQKTSIYGVTFDYNYFINLFRLRAQVTYADLHSDVFLIKYNTALLSQIDSGSITPNESLQLKVDQMLEQGTKAAAALRALIFQSSVAPLYNNFKSKQFEIDHGLKISEKQMKLLWYRATQLDQHYEVKIQKTELPETVDGGKVENIPIYIASDRKGELRGRDLFGFSLEGLNGYLSEKFQKKAPQYQTGGQNPSQMPFGFANWRTIRTDSEVTESKREGSLPTVAVIDHIWGGWSLKRKQMDTILDELKEQMKQIKVANFPLIPEGALGSVDKVDFFKLTSHLALLPNAVDQVKALILSSESKEEVSKIKFATGLFQKLSEFQGKARAEDQVLYKNLMKMIGNGDEKQGLINYKAQCEINRQQLNQESGNPFPTYTWSRGTGYECLEPWVEKIMKLSREFPENDKRKQNRWMTEVLYVLDEQIPQAYFLNYLGADKFIYYVQLIGFRAGDEDGDDGLYLSNVFGAPDKSAPYADGLLGYLAQKNYINPVEFEKQGSF